MINDLLKIINKVEGNILTIGVENNKLIKKIGERSDYLYSITKDSRRKKFFSKNKLSDKKGKRINFKKLKKYFKKKSIDYCIMDYDNIAEYSKYIVKDNIYLNKNKTYIYCDNDNVDLTSLIKMYKRYNVQIETIKKEKYFILIIDNTNSKRKIIMEKIYFIIDTFYNITDAISDALIS